MNGPFRSGTGTPIGPMAVAMVLLKMTEVFFFCPTGWADITVGSGRSYKHYWPVGTETFSQHARARAVRDIERVSLGYWQFPRGHLTVATAGEKYPTGSLPQLK